MRILALTVWLSAILSQSEPLPGGIDVGTALVAYGVAAPFAALAVWWAWQERRERIAIQKQRDAERAEVVPLIARAVEVLSRVQAGMGATVERVHAPDARDVDALLGKLSRVVDYLEDDRRETR